jgi:hypothetical protein
MLQSCRKGEKIMSINYTVTISINYTTDIVKKLFLRFYSEMKASGNNESSLEVVRGIRGEA